MLLASPRSPQDATELTPAADRLSSAVAVRGWRSKGTPSPPSVDLVEAGGRLNARGRLGPPIDAAVIAGAMRLWSELPPDRVVGMADVASAGRRVRLSPEEFDDAFRVLVQAGLVTAQPGGVLRTTP